MRRRFVLPSLAVAMVLPSACAVRIRPPGAAVQSAGDPDDSVPRVEADTTFADFQAGGAIVIDVRGPISYGDRHAAGAILIPLDEVEKSPAAVLAKLPAGKRPILYCT